MELNNWTEHNQQLASKTGQAQMDSDLIFFIKRLKFHFLGFTHQKKESETLSGLFGF